MRPVFTCNLKRHAALPSEPFPLLGALTPLSPLPSRALPQAKRGRAAGKWGRGKRGWSGKWMVEGRIWMCMGCVGTMGAASASRG
eukprot:429432-Rhodomonas_salina.6